MQNLAYSHPYVYSVSLDGNQLTLLVEVTNFQGTEGAIEVSGQASQVNGAFANISSFVDIAHATANAKGELVATVTANADPAHPFTGGEDVTIFVRVAKVWITVLGAPEGVTSATASPTWNVLRAVTQIDGEAWPVPAGSPAPGAGPAS